ncbi:Cell wall hydrolase, SleB [uncultured Caudovirales phage]|uniref:Cell wall hydrolase, SleB n=1 Tax=uncultured Caudovirales phage TaxID=2100421 RepID=A0A6J5L8T2_9CAUD|nr:Cell wall hydrolase, SleB [uncultured Caudovirales phage]
MISISRVFRPIFTLILVSLLVSANQLTDTEAQTADGSKELNADVRCLAETIYYEARNQSTQGKLAVGLVVINRTANKQYPNTVCGVVYQSLKRGVCQFSWACHQRSAINENDPHWDKSVILAQRLLSNTSKYKNLAPGALYFHATHVSPAWSQNLKYITTIDDHKFYKGNS